MVDYKQKIFNLFVSYSSDQFDIYNNICEKYKDTNINIIDVSEKYTSVNDKLCENILQQINNTHIFISILIPIKINSKTFINNKEQIVETLSINNNVLLELGYAYSCLEFNNISIFIENDEYKKKKFEELRCSMLSQNKYNTYDDHGTLIEFILNEWVGESTSCMIYDNKIYKEQIFFN